GRRRRGSGGRTGHHHLGIPHARDSQRGQSGSAEIMTTNLHLWLIPLLPLVGAAINGLLGRGFSKRAVAIIGVGFPGAALAWALVVASRFLAMPLERIPYSEYILPWIAAGSFQANIAFYLDQLSLVMLLVVTGVGFLIHVYSVGYMGHEG